MEKTDLTKKFRSYYTAKTKPELIEIEPAQFLSISGKGDPSGQSFADNIGALYATAYTVKFICKDMGLDFVVAKLEGLWSFDEEKYKGLSITDASSKVPRSEWIYRIMIRMPEYVTPEQVATAVQNVVTKKQILLAKEIELYKMSEGKSVQMLHVGPFSAEPETLEQMREFMTTRGLQRNGLHHEIYLSDFRKTAPDKLKTILREPVK